VDQAVDLLDTLKFSKFYKDLLNADQKHVISNRQTSPLDAITILNTIRITLLCVFQTILGIFDEYYALLC
jgi:hypothetical protein